ncbi:MAG: response regulator [Lentimicrobiaceae bacterium]
MAGKLISSISESINAWTGKSILIVEDVTSNYSYLAATINRSGVSITWVKSGEEALECINQGNHFDLILMDVQLSGMDGYQVTGMIKAIHPEIPIIAQTAYAMLGEKEKSQKAGCDEYLSKPIKPSILLETISKYL